ncbi:MAG: TIM barrel protein [Alistipes sp.]|nr:TIM barrel protein [Alistipes sp.]
MDRLTFFKQGFSSLLDAAQSAIGLKHAADSFTEAVEEALSNIKTDIGLYLPSLDAGMYEDPQGTICDIAEMGYTLIEVGAYAAGKIHNLPAARIKELADNAHLKIAGAHINKLHERVTLEEEAKTTEAVEEKAKTTDAVDQETKTIETVEKEATQETVGAGTVVEPTAKTAEVKPTETSAKPDPNVVWWSKALDQVKRLGCGHVVMSRLPDYPTDEVIDEYIAYFNLIGDLAAERGLQFCFHPRKVDMTPIRENPSVLDRIIEGCDKEKVALEIDTREATDANVDIVQLLKQQGKRVHLLHIHDYGITCESGRIDFDKIIAEGVRSGVKDIFVEVSSYSLPPKNCVERSIQNLQNLPSVRY